MPRRLAAWTSGRWVSKTVTSISIGEKGTKKLVTEASGVCRVWLDVPNQWPPAPTLAGSSGPSQGDGKAMADIKRRQAKDTEATAHVSGQTQRGRSREKSRRGGACGRQSQG